MAKYIINDKIYDTEKAENVFEYKRKENGAEMLFRPGYYWIEQHECKLYRTNNGNWFEVSEYNGRSKAHITTISDVKQIFKHLNEVELYNKYFEELEEA